MEVKPYRIHAIFTLNNFPSEVAWFPVYGTCRQNRKADSVLEKQELILKPLETTVFTWRPVLISAAGHSSGFLRCSSYFVLSPKHHLHRVFRAPDAFKVFGIIIA